MTFSIFQTTVQILTQDILPIVSSPILWTLLSLFVIALLLRACFPCVTLSGLERRIETVQKTLKEYKDIGSVLNTNDIMSGFINYEHPSRRVAFELEKRLRRITQDAHKIFSEDHKTSWISCLSLRRVIIISLLSKKLYTLERDIKYTQTVALKYRNNQVLELMSRISPDTASEHGEV
ncbi:hypothetical protein EV368DRAFT_66513 [Lentinula lateritia]|uniref:Uncharacterized protein n=1 Tax=Lentinula aff. lateritia TaxID=2804960 RepID=A0ACC1UAK5_9AGAR|nr:hypothetical protein F5876DRAFT_62849 [Lentinula aff. lateritia]KAJ3850549.1 hypothetical protein EV368DRAFT_66513 [Lentinula lateritia]